MPALTQVLDQLKNLQQIELQQSNLLTKQTQILGNVVETERLYDAKLYKGLLGLYNVAVTSGEEIGKLRIITSDLSQSLKKLIISTLPYHHLELVSYLKLLTEYSSVLPPWYEDWKKVTENVVAGITQSVKILKEQSIYLSEWESYLTELQQTLSSDIETLLEQIPSISSTSIGRTIIDTGLLTSFMEFISTPLSMMYSSVGIGVSRPQQVLIMTPSYEIARRAPVKARDFALRLSQYDLLRYILAELTAIRRFGFGIRSTSVFTGDLDDRSVFASLISSLDSLLSRLPFVSFIYNTFKDITTILQSLISQFSVPDISEEVPEPGFFDRIAFVIKDILLGPYADLIANPEELFRQAGLEVGRSEAEEAAFRFLGTDYPNFVLENLKLEYRKIGLLERIAAATEALASAFLEQAGRQDLIDKLTEINEEIAKKVEEQVSKYNYVWDVFTKRFLTPEFFQAFQRQRIEQVRFAAYSALQQSPLYYLGLGRIGAIRRFIERAREREAELLGYYRTVGPEDLLRFAMMREMGIAASERAGIKFTQGSELFPKGAMETGILGALLSYASKIPGSKYVSQATEKIASTFLGTIESKMGTERIKPIEKPAAETGTEISTTILKSISERSAELPLHIRLLTDIREYTSVLPLWYKDWKDFFAVKATDENLPVLASTSLVPLTQTPVIHDQTWCLNVVSDSCKKLDSSISTLATYISSDFKDSLVSMTQMIQSLSVKTAFLAALVLSFQSSVSKILSGLEQKFDNATTEIKDVIDAEYVVVENLDSSVEKIQKASSVLSNVVPTSFVVSSVFDKDNKISDLITLLTDVSNKFDSVSTSAVDYLSQIKIDISNLTNIVDKICTKSVLPLTTQTLVTPSLQKEERLQLPNEELIKVSDLIKNIISEREYAFAPAKDVITRGDVAKVRLDVLSEAHLGFSPLEYPAFGRDKYEIVFVRYQPSIVGFGISYRPESSQISKTLLLPFDFRTIKLPALISKEDTEKVVTDNVIASTLPVLVESSEKSVEQFSELSSKIDSLVTSLEKEREKYRTIQSAISEISKEEERLPAVSQRSFNILPPIRKDRFTSFLSSKIADIFSTFLNTISSIGSTLPISTGTIVSPVFTLPSVYSLDKQFTQEKYTKFSELIKQEYYEEQLKLQTQYIRRTLDFYDWFEFKFDKLLARVDDIYDILRKIDKKFDKLGSGASGGFGGLFGGLFSGLTSLLLTPLVFLGKKILSAGKKVLSKSGELAGKALTKVGITDLIKGAGAKVGATLAKITPTKIFESIKTNIGDIFTKTGVKEGFKDISEKVVTKSAQTLGKVTSLSSSVAKTVTEASKGIGSKIASKVFSKGGLSIAKKVPLIGLGVGAGLGVYRLLKGDYVGAGMELASGAASLIPGYGTAASIGIDAAIIARDVKMHLDKEASELKTVSEQVDKSGKELQESVKEYQDQQKKLEESISNVTKEVDKAVKEISSSVEKSVKKDEVSKFIFPTAVAFDDTLSDRINKSKVINAITQQSKLEKSEILNKQPVYPYYSMSESSQLSTLTQSDQQIKNIFDTTVSSYLPSIVNKDLTSNLSQFSQRIATIDVAKSKPEVTSFNLNKMSSLVNTVSQPLTTNIVSSQITPSLTSQMTSLSNAVSSVSQVSHLKDISGSPVSKLSVYMTAAGVTPVSRLSSDMMSSVIDKSVSEETRNVVGTISRTPVQINSAITEAIQKNLIEREERRTIERNIEEIRPQVVGENLELRQFAKAVVPTPAKVNPPKAISVEQPKITDDRDLLEYDMLPIYPDIMTKHLGYYAIGLTGEVT